MKKISGSKKIIFLLAVSLVLFANPAKAATGYLQIVTKTLNPNGSDASGSASFTYTISGPTTASATVSVSNGTGLSDLIPIDFSLPTPWPGPYNTQYRDYTLDTIVTQNPTSAWRLDSMKCQESTKFYNTKLDYNSHGKPPGNVAILDYGITTCVFTNIAVPPPLPTGTLKVVQNTVNNIGPVGFFIFPTPIQVTNLTVTNQTSASDNTITLTDLPVGDNYILKQSELFFGTGATACYDPKVVPVQSITGKSAFGMTIVRATCDNGFLQTVNGARFSILAGQTTTCTFTNALQGDLQIVKDVTDGEKDKNFTYNYEVSGPTIFTGSITTVNGTGSLGPIPVDIGLTYESFYTIREVGQEDAPTSAVIICDNTSKTLGAGVESQVVVVPGQTTTCTFTSPGAVVSPKEEVLPESLSDEIEAPRPGPFSDTLY